MNISFRPQFAAKCMNKDDFKGNLAIKAIIEHVLEKTPNTDNVRFWLKQEFDEPGFDQFSLTTDKYVDGAVIEGSNNKQPNPKRYPLLDAKMFNNFTMALQETEKLPKRDHFILNTQPQA